MIVTGIITASCIIAFIFWIVVNMLNDCNEKYNRWKAGRVYDWEKYDDEYMRWSLKNKK